MGLIAGAVSSAGYALLPWLAIRLRVGVHAGVLAGVIGGVLPLLPGLEAHGQWEAPVVILLCIVAVGLTAGGPAIVAGIVWGITFLFNPALLPVLVCSLSTLRWRRMVLIGCGATLCVSPWIGRNYFHFGTLFWVRSGFGMELALSHHPDARTSFWENHQQTDIYNLHPYRRKVCPEVRRVGEVAYFNGLGMRAVRWAVTHPARTIRLTLARIANWWLPPLRPWPRRALALGTALLAFTGLFWMRGTTLAVGLGAIVAYPFPYYLVQSDARYRLPTEPLLLLYSAATAISLLGRWLRLSSGDHCHVPFPFPFKQHSRERPNPMVLWSLPHTAPEQHHRESDTRRPRQSPESSAR
jgi:hypothetical protein